MAEVIDARRMNESEFRKELQRSIIVLSTSSPDKRDIYRLLFSELGKDDRHYAGLNAYFTDSGSLGIATRKTEEMNNDYDGNLGEKRDQQLKLLQKPDTSELIGLKLNAVPNKLWGEDGIKVVGMTEDSGWNLNFKDKATERAFIEVIVREMAPKLRPQDSWLLEKLHNTGFPGPNLKPLQEHLEGGFADLMKIIFKATKELDIQDLRYTNTTNISFVSPRLGKYYQIKKESHGRMITEAEYEERKSHLSDGEAINSNFVHIPDGQVGEELTVGELIRKGLHTKSSAELPASYARREITEYLQKLIGKCRSSYDQRKRPVKIAYVTPDLMDDAKAETNINVPLINDFQNVGLPTRDELVHHPHVKQFDHADAIVLMPKMFKKSRDQLQSDPNFRMLLNVLVTAETDPESMGVPIVLDNRTGLFKDVLDLLSDAFVQGNIMGELPIHVVNTDAEMKRVLSEIKDVRQRTPIIKKHHDTVNQHNYKPDIESVPNDGVYTVFIGGGHATNSKRDMSDAEALGYMCAEKGWRIVTGAGSVEGVMGAAHTGFVQYHLDQFATQPGHETLKVQLSKYMHTPGHYDAEMLIKKNPRLVEEMAKEGLIPRKMFFGYSMDPLLEMESPSGRPPPGITYYDAGNRFRRLQGLLDAGTKIFMPGGIGTYEELEETLAQHLKARSTDATFKEGTPAELSRIIIYNRNGNVSKLLEHYGLLGDSPEAQKMRKNNGIEVIDQLEALKGTASESAANWQSRVAGERKADRSSDTYNMAP